MRSPRTVLAFAAVVASASAMSRRTSAQPGDAAGSVATGVPSGVDVTWSAPDDCPPSAELRRRVLARVPGDAAVRARGRVEKRGGRYRLALEIATASSRGERTLDAPTCEALASSAAVIIAISVAPAGAPDEAPASSASPGAEPAAAPAAAAAPVPASSATPAPASAERTTEGAPGEIESSARFLARAEVTGDAGLLPAATVGGGVAFGVLALHRLSIEVGANLFASQDGTVSSAPGRGASFSLLSAGARACWTLTHGIEVAPCVGFEVARISASGFGAAKVADADAVTWGPEALLTGKLPIAGPLSIRAGIGGFAPISRQSFVISAAGTVHRPAAVALRTFAGPEVRF